MMTRRHLIVLPWALWLVMVLAVLAIAWFFPVYAASYTVTDTQGNSVTLFDEPCAQTTDWLKMQRALMRWHGGDYAACWVNVGDAVIIFDSSGDTSALPVQTFTRDQAI